MQLSEIHIYPIKGTAGTALESAEVRPRGLAGDRRWVIVDQQGQFLHQRIHPQLALLRASFSVPAESPGLQLDLPGRASLEVSQPDGENRISVTVWDDTLQAADAGHEAAEWLSSWLGLSCRLAFMDAQAERPVAAEYGEEGDVVSFADAVPLLVATAASLDDLNQRLPDSLPMSRFRPNLVVRGTEPWAEDGWKRLRVGDVEFVVTHPCARCAVTTVDQQTGERAGDGEPLKTLATFRRNSYGVCFGQNLVPRRTGIVRLNDPVQILE